MSARAVAIGGMILVAILLRTTVLTDISILTFRPDIVVIVVVAIALAEGPDSGIRIGFAAGLAQDLISGGSALVGLGALVMMAVGWIAGSAKSFTSDAERGAAVVLCGGLATVATLSGGVLGRLFGVVSPSSGRILTGMLIVGLYTAAVSPLVLRPVRWVLTQFRSPTISVNRPSA